ncbi:hypothetical protein PanWU01x14_072700 [Parasponia andersonii]|uniref:Uncharacterized protein n=1 Tax=Parasponia andersonii TaxID=3476 RepID=A0A2P5DDU9_PARAD|nr:hypothetical protein PanWU01x14_072700 [Parasponia andersonii]
MVNRDEHLEALLIRGRSWTDSQGHIRVVAPCSLPMRAESRPSPLQRWVQIVVDQTLELVPGAFPFGVKEVQPHTWVEFCQDKS